MTLEPSNSTDLSTIAATTVATTLSSSTLVTNATTIAASTLSTLASSFMSTIVSSTPHPVGLCTCPAIVHTPAPPTTVTTTTLTTTVSPTTTISTTSTTTLEANLTTVLTTLVVNVTKWGEAAHHEPVFGMQSPSSCFALKFISLFCVILMFFSLLFNGSLLFVFLKYKELQTPMNILILVLTILNLIGSCTELPFVITSNFLCR